MNFAVDEEKLGQIPDILKERPHWVGFKVEGDKKTPCVADNPSVNASSTNHETWRPFNVAADGLRRQMFNAVAYALNDDFVGIDLDECYQDGRLSQRASEIVKRCNSYVEKSISGHGVHILLKGSIPGGKGRKYAGIEVYGRNRFLITTGTHLPETPTIINENPDAVDWLLTGNVTETSEAIFSDCSAVSVDSVISVTSSYIQDLIRRTLPHRAGERNARLLDLARGLRFNCNLADKQYSILKPIVEEWHKAALPVIRTKDFCETWSDFVHAWPKACLPLENVLAIAWERAKSEPEPAVAKKYDSEPVRRLICLCMALARLSPDLHFFLSTHAAGKLLTVHPGQIHRWIKMLIADELLEEVKRGDQYRATRYRWKYPP